MDIKQTFSTANDALTDLVLRVRPEHLLLEVPAYARFDGDLLGDDLASNFDDLATAANDSVRIHADLDQIVHISYGDVPAGSYLSDVSLNRTMTLYDTAALTGLEPRLSEEAILAVHAIAAGYGDTLRQMGIFPPEVVVPVDATTEDRFLGFIGRVPRSIGRS
jgi:hypothetical protein